MLIHEGDRILPTVSRRCDELVQDPPILLTISQRNFKLIFVLIFHLPWGLNSPMV